MNITLHITSGCNMKCSYCYSSPNKRQDMEIEIIKKSIDLTTTFKNGKKGIVFFGGEPLLCKDLIFKTISICREIEKWGGHKYHFKITTNGLLLDIPFLQYAVKERIHVALSIDGIGQAHDQFRLTSSGAVTFKLIEERIDELLYYRPYAYALMTICPETVDYYCRSVKYLIKKGFRYIIASLDYSGKWGTIHLKQLQREYKKISRLYKKWTVEGRKFYFSPFEKKLSSHIYGEKALCQQCHFGINQISIAPDGKIYPCVQFVKSDHSGQEFCIGDVIKGIDYEKQQYLYQTSRYHNDNCQNCALKNRCEHQCSCLNWQTTGSINEISPILCESERILIPIVDQLGNTLYKINAPLFIQKHYNEGYPFYSYLEDQFQ